MQYHAASLAAAGGDVELIGLEGTPPIPAVSGDARIRVHRLPDRAFARRATGGVRRFVWGSALRALGQGVRLFATLMRIPRPDVILVQNPPAVPALSIAWLASRVRNCRFVIDWHNLSHTIAAVKVGEHHRAVKALARSERRWAKRADGHLAVSKALADWLAREYKVTAVVAYDRPSAAFAPPAAGAASALWDKIAAEHELGSTHLRQASGGQAHLRQGVGGQARPPIVVCPTSWTPDEDFDLLLEALERAERTLTRGDSPSGVSIPPLERVPALAVFLTGRGPLRDTFEQRAARRNFKVIAVRMLWLEPADYPTLVGMATLGLCLHQSSSGLDLPMKLADLRGAGVPVATYDYAPVLGEVMTTGREGVTFRDPGELANVFVNVATGDMPPDSALAKSRAWLAQNPPERWDVQWDGTARRVLLA
jgi:beta-1,4-mannosyltransferase